MAKARFYAIDNAKLDVPAIKKYTSNLKGQAKIVYDCMIANPEPKLASDFCEICKDDVKTTQDTLRVVLYYIIIFKGKGFVKSFDTLPEKEESVENMMAEVLQELRDEDTCN